MTVQAPSPSATTPSETRTLAIGEVLFREGDAGDNAYIIESGLIEISRRAGAGAEMIIGTASVGEMVGEMALIDSQPRSATAKALKPTVLTVVPKEDFDTALASADPAVRHLLARFVSIIRTMTDRNVRLTLGLR